MKNSGIVFKFIFVSLMAIVLSLSTLVFGAPMLRVLRKSFGAKIFWAEGLFVVLTFFTFGFHLFGVLLGALWLTVGLYIELEQKGVGWWSAGLFGIFSGVVFVASFASISYKLTDGKIWEQAQMVGEQLVAQLKDTNPGIQMEANLLFLQVPSMIFVLLMFGIGMGLIFEKSAYSLAQLPRERVASQLRLLEFRVPDFYIWIALTALLFSVIFVKPTWMNVLALNIVNVSALLYFFQGLAIVETFLRYTRVGIFIKLMVFLILIGKMFTVVSFVGLIDFWIGFRERLRRYIAR